MGYFAQLAVDREMTPQNCPFPFGGDPGPYPIHGALVLPESIPKTGSWSVHPSWACRNHELCQTGRFGTAHGSYKLSSAVGHDVYGRVPRHTASLSRRTRPGNKPASLLPPTEYGWEHPPHTGVRGYVFYVFFGFQKNVSFYFFLKWRAKKS